MHLPCSNTFYRSTGRLSKRALLVDLRREASAMERGHRFDPNKGPEQVEGRPLATCIAYGQWLALCNIISAFDG